MAWTAASQQYKVDDQFHWHFMYVKQFFSIVNICTVTWLYSSQSNCSSMNPLFQTIFQYCQHLHGHMTVLQPIKLELDESFISNNFSVLSTFARSHDRTPANQIAARWILYFKQFFSIVNICTVTWLYSSQSNWSSMNPLFQTIFQYCQHLHSHMTLLQPIKLELDESFISNNFSVLSTFARSHDRTPANQIAARWILYFKQFFSIVNICTVTWLYSSQSNCSSMNPSFQTIFQYCQHLHSHMTLLQPIKLELDESFISNNFSVLSTFARSHDCTPANQIAARWILHFKQFFSIVNICTVTWLYSSQSNCSSMNPLFQTIFQYCQHLHGHMTVLQPIRQSFQQLHDSVADDDVLVLLVSCILNLKFINYS